MSCSPFGDRLRSGREGRRDRMSRDAEHDLIERVMMIAFEAWKVDICREEVFEDCEHSILQSTRGALYHSSLWAKWHWRSSWDPPRRWCLLGRLGHVPQFNRTTRFMWAVGDNTASCDEIFSGTTDHDRRTSSRVASQVRALGSDLWSKLPRYPWDGQQTDRHIIK